MADIDVLQKFYDRLRRSQSLARLDIPPSLVFYVRRALEDGLGQHFDLEHVYVACFLEGYVDPDKHFLEALPSWYVEKYFGGKAPDMEALRVNLRVLYQQHLERQAQASAEPLASGAD